MKKLPVFILLFSCLVGLASCLPWAGSQPMIKIGLVAPFEGLYRPLGYEVLAAAKLAIKERNQAGGAGGYMVELVALNDGQDPAMAAQRAKEMAVDPGIMGVVGHFDDDTTVAALPVYEQAGLVLLVPGAPAVELTELAYSHVFQLGADNGALGQAMARHAVVDRKARLLATIHGEEDLVAFFTAEAQELGAEVILDAELHQDGLVSMLAKASPDVVFFGGEALEAGELVLRMREAGLDSPLLGGNRLENPYLVQIAGEAAVGTMYVTSVPPVDDPEFIDAYRSLGGTYPGSYAALAYDATCILLDALQEAVGTDGKPTRAGVVGALSGGKSYQGLTGEISFDERRRALSDEVYIYEIVAGGYPGELYRKH